MGKDLRNKEFGGEEGAKTIEEVDQVEAVSGATISSNAIKAAVKKALQSEDPTEKPDAPAIKTADQRTRFVFSAAEPADLLITAPEGTQIRYTTDGSDPAGNAPGNSHMLYSSLFNGLIKFVHQNVHNRSLQRCAQVTLIFFDEIGVFFYFVSQ